MIKNLFLDLKKSENFQVATVIQAAAIVEAAVATAQTSENQLFPATKAEITKSEKNEQPKSTNAAGTEGGTTTSAPNSPITAKDIANAKTSTCKKSTREAISGKNFVKF